MKLDEKIIKVAIDLLPQKVNCFKGSEFPLPVKTAILGKDEVNLSNLSKELIEKKGKDIKNFLEPLLVVAELFEASQKDKSKYFITDNDLRDLVFMGSKWSAGWVLVLGGDDQKKLIEKLRGKEFIIFTDTPDIKETHFIGNRETSPIYFLQMMVRYGFIWGRIKPGDSHKMGHFLEKDMPGFIIINKDLNPLKYFIALGLMKLGAPAIVPSTFPYTYGNRVVADNIDDIIKISLTFPNLRLKYYKEEIIKLPEYCNVAYANEKIKNAKIWAGHNSFLLLKSAKGIKKSVNIAGKPQDSVGIIIEIEDDNLTYVNSNNDRKQNFRSSQRKEFISSPVGTTAIRQSTSSRKVGARRINARHHHF